MSDLLVKKLTADDFDAEKYVQSLSSSSVGGIELQQQKQRIQQLAKETSSLLKKNVYNNYMQFIETAKEISYLESEMYQLSHLITEQKTLLSSMLEIAVSADKGPGCGGGVPDSVEVMENPVEACQRMEKENRKKMTVLLENIEGCSHVLEEPQRWLLYEGDLVELSQNDYSGQQRVRACLLNDSFMLATWLADRRGPIRYRFESLYLLDSLVPVNIKDRGQATNAFKLLIFPDARVFQAPSTKVKEEWLEQLEKAKHLRVSAEQQAEQVTKPSEKNSTDSRMHEQDSIDSQEESHSFSNPFSSFCITSNALTQVPQTPAWLQELPEDFDQAIAQRNFEDALVFLQRAKEYFASPAAKTPASVELKRLMDSRVKTLISVVSGELRMSGERSRNAGPKAARRTAAVLIKLNRQQLACELFLQYRSSVLSSALHGLRLEGSVTAYIRHLGAVFFHNLSDTIVEFNKVFSLCKSCLPALLVWTNDSMSIFTNKFSQHVFSMQSSLTVVSECVCIADHYCNLVSVHGLDLRFTLHASLSRELERRVVSARDQMLDAIKLRAQDESWQPTRFEDQQHLDTFIEEMNDIGIAGLKEFITDDLELGLTSSVIELVRVLVCFLEDVLRLQTVWSDAQRLLADSLTVVLEGQLQQCLCALEHHMLQGKVGLIRLNSLFVLDVLVSLCEQRYTEVTGFVHPTLNRLRRLRPRFEESDDASNYI